MERFCVFTVLLMLAVIGTVVWIAVGMFQSSARDFEHTVVFDSSAFGTQSHAEAKVNQLVVNDDRTRAVLYFTFTDPGAVPGDVDDYAVHITGLNKNRSAQRDYNRGIGGSYYLYGSSGDALIYMTCPSGFDDGVYRVSLEATDMVTSDGQDVSDVFQFDIHPGAASTSTSDALAGDKFDAAAFYADIMLSDQESAAKNDLETALEMMNEYMNAVDEYGERLRSEGIVVDGKMPPVMAGDEIGTDSQGNLFLTSGKDFPNALNIDWRNSSVMGDGYAKFVDMGGLSLSEYLVAMSEFPDDRTSMEVQGEWMFSDGRDFETVHSANASTHFDEIADDIERYSAAVSSYTNMKKFYQTTYQQRLLQIEEQAMTMADTVKVKVDCVEAY